MSNASRIFYPTHACAFSQPGSLAFTEVHGLQSIGINTTFNLEQVFEIGQIDLYENIEGTPDIEVTTEKVLDGYPLVYHHATKGSASATLVGRSATKTIMGVSIYGDTQDSASGVPISQVTMSGLAVSAFSYNFVTDGNFTESVTMVGNDKVWKTAIPFTFSGNFTNTDFPLSIAGSGGVNRREDFIWQGLGTGVYVLDANSHIAYAGGGVYRSILPGGGGGGIPGLTASGSNPLLADGTYNSRIQSVAISTDLGREELFQLGRRNPYFRFVTFPIEVTCDVEVIATSGDLVEATEDGVLGNGNNLADKTIHVYVREGTAINLGTKNKLNSVTHSGGDTGGANVSLTYSYSNFNFCSVFHWNDPTTSLRIPQP